MTIEALIQFAFASLLPVLASAALVMLDRKTQLSASKPAAWQFGVGIIFGLIATFGTEMGISTHDATMNVRDAAPLAAGLLFGGPAGIIAGIIGGVERWFAALWGRGMFTRVACSVATIAAGLIAAAFRKFIFENKRPQWLFAAALGIVVEVLHLTMVFLTNMNEPQEAFRVVQACTGPMVFFNALSILLAVIVVALIEREPLVAPQERRPISDSIQGSMLIAVILAFLLTTGFTALLQSRISDITTTRRLNLSIGDVDNELAELSDQALLDLTHQVAAQIPRTQDAQSVNLDALKANFGVAEIDIIDATGTICASSEPDYVGFDMKSGMQSMEFLKLLPPSAMTELVQPYQPISKDASISRKYAGVQISDGFIQLAYDGQQLQNALQKNLATAVHNRHVGETGSLIIMAQDGTIVTSDENLALSEQDISQLNDAFSAHEQDSLFTVSLGEENHYCTYANTESYRVVAIEPQDEADFGRDVAVLVSALMEVLVFALLFVTIFYLLRQVVVRSIHSINDSLEEITRGNLDVVVGVRSNEEFSSLSDGINSTVTTLKRYISEAAARIDQELEYARSIQQSALPSVCPAFPTPHDFDIYASMRAAKEVGGDFYDFYFVDEHHLAFLIADVSGKGIPAALFMMRAKSVLKSLAETGLSVDEILANANTRLATGNETSMFVTAWMGVVDLRNGHVRYANAGHNPPALQLGGTDYSLLKTKRNLILGCMEGIPYLQQEFTMEPGDTIFLYTDGIVEANSTTEELYGDDRMLESLNRLKGSKLSALCDGVRNDVDEFVGEAPQFDDMTMLAFTYYGSDGTANSEQ